jgi:hypothetical protein
MPYRIDFKDTLESQTGTGAGDISLLKASN